MVLGVGALTGIGAWYYYSKSQKHEHLAPSKQDIVSDYSTFRNSCIVKESK